MLTRQMQNPFGRQVVAPSRAGTLTIERSALGWSGFGQRGSRRPQIGIDAQERSLVSLPNGAGWLLAA